MFFPTQQNVLFHTGPYIDSWYWFPIKFQKTTETYPRYPKVQIWKDCLPKEVTQDPGYVGIFLDDCKKRLCRSVPDCRTLNAQPQRHVVLKKQGRLTGCDEQCFIRFMFSPLCVYSYVSSPKHHAQTWHTCMTLFSHSVPVSNSAFIPIPLPSTSCCKGHGPLFPISSFASLPETSTKRKVEAQKSSNVTLPSPGAGREQDQWFAASKPSALVKWEKDGRPRGCLQPIKTAIIGFLHKFPCTSLGQLHGLRSCWKGRGGRLIDLSHKQYESGKRVEHIYTIKASMRWMVLLLHCDYTALRGLLVSQALSWNWWYVGLLSSCLRGQLINIIFVFHASPKNI